MKSKYALEYILRESYLSRSHAQQDSLRIRYRRTLPEWNAVLVARNDLAAAQDRLLETIRLARQAGVPWERIGEIFNITAAAAFQRYGKQHSDSRRTP